MNEYPNRRKRGAITVWVAVMLATFIVFVSLSLDTGLLVLSGTQLQAGADASALAGARLVTTDLDDARNASLNIALANKAAGSAIELDVNTDIVFGRYDLQNRTFDESSSQPNAVKVIARRTTGSPGGPIDLLFGSIFGKSEADVQREAIAMVAGSSGPNLLILNRNQRCALEMDSNARIEIENGSLQVNSSHSKALCMESNAYISAPTTNVVGEVDSASNARIDGLLNEGAPPIEDPLREVPEPSFNPLLDLGAIDLASNSSLVAAPGYYSGGINLDNNARLTLLPGIYILDGVGLHMDSNSQISGDGVMFYIIDSTPGNGTESTLDLDSNTIIDLAPPDKDTHFFPGADTYHGISVFMSRDNRNDVHLDSNSYNIGGVLYMSSNHVDLSSNSGLIDSRLIADTLTMNSNATITISGDSTGPSAPVVFLVE